MEIPKEIWRRGLRAPLGGVAERATLVRNKIK